MTGNIEPRGSEALQSRVVASLRHRHSQRENGGRRQTREAARGRAAQSSWKRGEDQQAAPARDSGVDAVAIPRARAPSSLFK
ncbi:hypothetical protein PF005_g6028 [Phytophthora fragariae]|uniref:Uncharacterized protein n=1 Tax=Phytophthora fragariae TaxID=53985 RepID=A0A6A3YTM6_9STRA|nr:hypothetical protein PF007_g6306 [Phytophthora fragariae]KAE9125940.1 hypothetical protein PF010_g5454 [Phytophthora fragariae]KAE9224139.1 hypothetical protein PF005_g6028 [Phytophthora fragariae]